jgi:hypothetical protein
MEKKEKKGKKTVSFEDTHGWTLCSLRFFSTECFLKEVKGRIFGIDLNFLFTQIRLVLGSVWFNQFSFKCFIHNFWVRIHSIFRYCLLFLPIANGIEYLCCTFIWRDLIPNDGAKSLCYCKDSLSFLELYLILWTSASGSIIDLVWTWMLARELYSENFHFNFFYNKCENQGKCVVRPHFRILPNNRSW